MFISDERIKEIDSDANNIRKKHSKICRNIYKNTIIEKGIYDLLNQINQCPDTVACIIGGNAWNHNYSRHSVHLPFMKGNYDIIIMSNSKTYIDTLPDSKTRRKAKGKSRRKPKGKQKGKSIKPKQTVYGINYSIDHAEIKKIIALLNSGLRYATGDKYTGRTINPSKKPDECIISRSGYQTELRIIKGPKFNIHEQYPINGKNLLYCEYGVSNFDVKKFKEELICSDKPILNKKGLVLISNFLNINRNMDKGSNIDIVRNAIIKNNFILKPETKTIPKTYEPTPYMVTDFVTKKTYNMIDKDKVFKLFEDFCNIFKDRRFKTIKGSIIDKMFTEYGATVFLDPSVPGGITYSEYKNKMMKDILDIGRNEGITLRDIIQLLICKLDDVYDSCCVCGGDAFRRYFDIDKTSDIDVKLKMNNKYSRLPIFICLYIIREYLFHSKHFNITQDISVHFGSKQFTMNYDYRRQEHISSVRYLHINFPVDLMSLDIRFKYRLTWTNPEEYKSSKINTTWNMESTLSPLDIAYTENKYNINRKRNGYDIVPVMSLGDLKDDIELNITDPGRRKGRELAGKADKDKERFGHINDLIARIASGGAAAAAAEEPTYFHDGEDRWVKLRQERGKMVHLQENHTHYQLLSELFDLVLGLKELLLINKRCDHSYIISRTLNAELTNKYFILLLSYNRDDIFLYNLVYYLSITSQVATIYYTSIFQDGITRGIDDPYINGKIPYRPIIRYKDPSNPVPVINIRYNNVCDTKDNIDTELDKFISDNYKYSYSYIPNIYMKPDSHEIKDRVDKFNTHCDDLGSLTIYKKIGGLIIKSYYLDKILDIELYKAVKLYIDNDSDDLSIIHFVNVIKRKLMTGFYNNKGIDYLAQINDKGGIGISTANDLGEVDTIYNDTRAYGDYKDNLSAYEGDYDSDDSDDSGVGGGGGGGSGDSSNSDNDDGGGGGGFVGFGSGGGGGGFVGFGSGGGGGGFVGFGSGGGGGGGGGGAAADEDADLGGVDGGGGGVGAAADDDADLGGVDGGIVGIGSGGAAAEDNDEDDEDLNGVNIF